MTDASGNAITDPSHIANVNPIRYRGYYYDTETGFYYLQSRYYNPEWCRFLNADVLFIAGDEITGANMFAYCSNNPVTLSDPTGYTPQIYASDARRLLRISAGLEPNPYGVNITAADARAVLRYSSGLTSYDELGTKLLSVINDMFIALGSVFVNLGGGISFRIDPASLKMSVQRHIHVLEGGINISSYNEDGTIHEGHKFIREPSNKTKKAIEKTGKWFFDNIEHLISLAEYGYSRFIFPAISPVFGGFPQWSPSPGFSGFPVPIFGLIGGLFA